MTNDRKDIAMLPMSPALARRPALRILPLALLAVLAALGAGLLAVGPTSAAIGSVCPTPTGQVSGGLDVCTDRGDNATYQAGDQITVCVTANVPQIMIYPPPPPPTVRVDNVLADGSMRPLIEARMASGQQCANGTIEAPFGQETIRAQVVSTDGKVIQEKSITITTAPH